MKGRGQRTEGKGKYREKGKRVREEGKRRGRLIGLAPPPFSLSPLPFPFDLFVPLPSVLCPLP
jgi:hypothetical protein